MVFSDEDGERAEAYRILADLYSEPPQEEQLDAIKGDLELNSTESADEIRADFQSLFVYPGGRIPPLESLFLSRASIPPVTPVTEFYSGADLTIEEEFEMMPDHISLEFLFMSYLIDIKNIDLQSKFLEEHLMNWVPYYCEEVKREAQTLFYKEIAGTTADFLASEQDNFE